ncbi:hypothetical protein GCM10025868_16020 [Angustibacter aerolatus]|uniref:Uncharacterized protein n=1 Tax=Angustibacter aerolatus TaxID=1162965 RepID=A0ABQ6JDT5_9ACTN|nr:hypothetical protein [Angustibacter aerolatus]GMA86352.1 hypothetical protein GCM10025868_16020 [Angustibacter aerolatus]
MLVTRPDGDVSVPAMIAAHVFVAVPGTEALPAVPGEVAEDAVPTPETANAR